MRIVTKIKLMAFIFSIVSGFTGLSVVKSQAWSTCIICCICCGVCLVMTTVLIDMQFLSPAKSHSWQSLVLQYLIIRVLTSLGRVWYNSFLKKSSKVTDIQQKILIGILKRNKNTVYGVDWELSELSSREQFVKKHPLTKYRHYRKYVESIMKGEQGVLTQDPVVYLATTSGTTGPSKHIPITSHMKSSYGPRAGAMMYYMMHKKGGLNLQRVFILSHSMTTKPSAGGLMMGPTTAHMSRVIPFAVSPPACFSLTKEHLSIHVHAVFALREREIGHIEVLMSPLIFSFWQYLDANWRDVCSEIECGILSPREELDEVTRKSLQTQLSPRPHRAEELRRCFLAGREGLAKRIWPDLRFVRMLTTGSFAHYADALREREMRDVVQITTLHAASEGIIGIHLPPDMNCYSYAVCFDYGFIEFIQEEDIMEEEPSTLFCEQVRCGEAYELVVTTPMGLYRYRTGDIVRITHFINQCPVYEFVRRSGQALDVYWEKTPESVFCEAVQTTMRGLSGRVWLSDYTATENSYLPAEFDKTRANKHYVLFVELEGVDAKTTPFLTDFETRLFDKTLQETHELYQQLRNSGSIGCMRVVQVRSSTFQRMKSMMNETTQTQQFKMPRILRDKKYLQYLLEQQIA